mgnify:FL=1
MKLSNSFVTLVAAGPGMHSLDQLPFSKKAKVAK